MSTDAPLTVRDLLPRRFDRLGDLMQRELKDTEETRRLGVPAFVWSGMVTPVSDAIRKALDVDVLEELAGAWAKAHELHAFKDARRHPRGKPETLTLKAAEFKMASLHPVVQLSTPGFKLRALRFTLELGAKFDAAMLTILDGHVTAVSAVECTFSAQLKYGEVKLHDPLKSPPLKPLREFVFARPGLPIP